MTTITVEYRGEDVPRSHCEECGAAWFIYWERNVLYHDGPRYCPFCGEEAEVVEVTR